MGKVIHHGPESCHNLGGPGEPYYQPCIVCWCGWSIRLSSWEMVGVEFDGHIADAAKSKRKKARRGR